DGVEGNPLGADVVGIDLSQMITGNLAEKGSLASKTGNTGRRVAGAASRSLDGRTHAGIEKFGALGIDQVHRPLDDAVFLQEGLVASGDDVHDGVAYAKHVEFAHSCLRWKARGGGICAGKRRLIGVAKIPAAAQPFLRRRPWLIISL